MRSRLAVGLAILACFAVVFAVPFFVPVSPVVSDSYTFGFNNRAALILFLLTGIAFAWWSGGLGLLSQPAEASPADSRAPVRYLLSTLVITFLATGTAWLVYRNIGAINEGTYLMDRLQHLAAGEVLYRDFEFIYGPFLLEFPWLLHQGARLSLIDAYYLSWMLEWLLGVYLLWRTVAWCCHSSPRKSGIYLLTFLGFIFSVISLGPSYTPLRFVLAPFFAALVWRWQTRQGLLPSALISCVGAACILSVSPEQGVAFCAGTLAYFLFFTSRSLPRYWLSVALMVVCQAALFLLLLRSGLVRYMKGMAQGGYNLPLLPSLNTIVFLLLLLLALCILVNSVRCRLKGGPLEYLLLIGVAALPAAFGRCDAGHIFMNTTGAYLATWTVLSYHRSAGKWMAWSYLATAIFLPLALYQSNNAFMYPVKVALFAPGNPSPRLRHLAEAAMQHAFGPRRTQTLLAKWRAVYPSVQPSNLPPGSVLLAPFGYPSALALAGLPPMTNGRYRGLGNVMTQGEVEDKLNELATHPQTLLLINSSDCAIGGDPSVPAPAPSPEALRVEDREKRHELFLNLLPFYLPHVQHHDNLLAGVCRYVSTHYHVTTLAPPWKGAVVLASNARRE